MLDTYSTKLFIFGWYFNSFHGETDNFAFPSSKTYFVTQLRKVHEIKDLVEFTDNDLGGDIGSKSTTGIIFLPWKEYNHLAISKVKCCFFVYV